MQEASVENNSCEPPRVFRRRTQDMTNPPFLTNTLTEKIIQGSRLLKSAQWQGEPQINQFGNPESG
ncbi:hypothetical protein MNBD_ALPHA04-1782 [hydrothermal vent metagenome]|uniref:Uncharacterized protein n=1 Tax=hydrothermal vent metagenome TaxID=652676 RepID=A0A3B0SAR1_9ZZZZ